MAALNTSLLELNTDSNPIKNFERTRGGFLKLWIVGGIPNQPLIYRNEDGSTRTEYIKNEALFNPKSLNTGVARPVTLNHPPGAVLNENFAQQSVGISLQEFARGDDGEMVFAGVLWDEETISKILHNEYQFTSSGYFPTKTVNKDGVYEQTFRDYDHYSILTPAYVARAGSKSKIYLINKDAYMSNKTNEIPPNESSNPVTESVITTTVSTANKNQQDASQSNGGISSEESKTSSDTASKLEILLDWKPLLDSKGKSINFDATLPEIKRLILSCTYDQKVINQIQSDSEVNGLWLGFLSSNQSDSIQKPTQKDSVTTPLSTFFNQPQEDSIETARQEFIAKIEGKK